MLSRLTRNLVGLVAWLAGLLLLLSLNGIVVASNYVGLKVAFELLGYEMRPLHTDELVGWVFAVLAPTATLAHLFALAIALTVSGGTFFLIRLLFHAYTLYEDRVAYVEANREKEAQLALRYIGRDLVLAALFAFALFFVFRWDLELFRFRSLAGVVGAEYPSDATQLAAWEQQLEAHGGLFAWTATRVGAWGYLAVTILACIGLEYVALRTSEYWTRLIQGLEDLVTAGGAGAAAEAPPLEDATAAWAAPGSDGATSAVPPPPYEASAPHQGAVGGDGALFDPPPPEAPEDGPADAAGDGSVYEPVFPEAAGVDDPGRATRPVIGGEGAQVRLADALADPARYYVDRSTGDVWDRAYWTSLHE